MGEKGEVYSEVPWLSPGEAERSDGERFCGPMEMGSSWAWVGLVSTTELEASTDLTSE